MLNHSKTEEILKNLEKIFYEKLSEKTNWGRNDVKEMFTKSLNEALMKTLM